jgi:hypothetical protein
MSTEKTKLKLTIGAIIALGFNAALDKLGDDNISTADKYAIARTRKQISSHHKTFREQHLALVQRLGLPESEVIKLRIARLKADEKRDETLLKNLEEHLAVLDKNKTESWALDEADEAVMKEFNAKMDELKAVEFEVYLDHLVVLPEFSKLSSREIELLLEIVTPATKPAEPAA